MSDDSQCCICFDEISREKNNCITECGHAFCFACISKSLSCSKLCPYCRTPMVEVAESDDDSEYTDDDEDDDDDDEDVDDDEDGSITLTANSRTDSSDSNVDLDAITEMFEQKGYTLKDAIYLLLGGFNKTNDPKYSEEYCEKLQEDYVEILDKEEEIYNEIKYEIDQMTLEEMKSIESDILHNYSLKIKIECEVDEDEVSEELNTTYSIWYSKGESLTNLCGNDWVVKNIIDISRTRILEQIQKINNLVV